MRVIWGVWSAICFICFLAGLAFVFHYIGWLAALKMLYVFVVGGGILCLLALLILYSPLIIGGIIGILAVGIIETIKAVFRKLAQQVRPSQPEQANTAPIRGAEKSSGKICNRPRLAWHDNERVKAGKA